jgi:alkanesulfonate monooxygenase SsuD/methylene tetrahydromethanopterin reductase-like flavin-dependent oxidoreductase (luciferase family)
MGKILFGVHTGPQNCTLDDLRSVWHLADRSGFHWVSIWDHFYPAMLVPGDARGTCFEAVSIMTALAAETRNVRIGSLVYCISYRHPAVLANALVTVDHVSGGRMECGLGAGWSQLEYDAYGIPFLPIKDRLDQLEEGLQIVRSLFTQCSRARVCGSAAWARSGCCGWRPDTPTAGTSRSSVPSSSSRRIRC